MEENEDEKTEVKENQLINLKTLKREMLIKLLIIAAITTTMFSVILGIIVSKSAGKKEEAEKDEVIIEEKEEKEKEENPKLPVYSEEAKARLKSIYEASGEEKIAYLTFDDGPSEKITPQILETLKNEDVKATFFVLGSRVELYPQIVKQEYDEGHYIANHGYSHVYTNIYAAPNNVIDEYNRAEMKIREAIGREEYSSHLFRFPGGSEGGKYKVTKDAAKTLLEENNIGYINWNCLNNDSIGKPTHESLILDLKNTKGDKKKIVILMHDSGTKQLTADTLLEIITYLKSEGYVFKNFYDIMY